MLKKGFSKKFKFYSPRKFLIAGITIAIAYSSLFYLFLLCFREFFRVFAFMMAGQELTILTHRELLFYNFFLAFIASLTGFAVGFEFLVRFQKIPAHIKYSLLVNQSGVQWNFNYWFAKLAVLFGLLSISMPLFDHIDFYHEFYFLFPLLVIVLFLNQWTKARLFFKGKVRNFMITVGCCQFTFSLFMSLLPIIDYEGLNVSLSKLTADYYCDYELPSSNVAYGLQRRSVPFELYMGFSKEKKDSVILVSYWHDGIKPLRVDDISAWISNSRAQLAEIEHQNMIIELLIDKEMPMKEVKKVFNALRTADARRLHLSVRGRHIGLPWMLMPLCAEVNEIDTMLSFQSSSPISCAELLKRKSRTPIELSSNNMAYNDSVRDISEITNLIKSDIEKIRDSSFFEVLVDDESSYEAFLKLQEVFRTAYTEVWQKEAKKQFGLTLSAQDFRHFNFDPELNENIREVKWKYPMNLVFWSDQEIEYFHLRRSN